VSAFVGREHCFIRSLIFSRWLLAFFDRVDGSRGRVFPVNPLQASRYRERHAVRREERRRGCARAGGRKPPSVFRNGL